MVRQAPETDTKLSLAAALEAMRDGKPLRTEFICREFLAETPGSIDHLRLLGHALLKQARYAEAEQAVRLAISIQPDFPHLHEDLGSVLAMQERYEEAVPCFREAIRLEPQLPLAYKKLGQALAALGRGAEADTEFEEFLDRDPERGRVARALELAHAGRRDEAIGELREALRENPDNVDALRHLGQLYLRERKQLSDAEALLRRAVAIAPDYLPAWIMLGTLLHEVARYADAAEAYRTATGLEPANAMAWGGLATALAPLGRVEESLRAFERSLALQPDSPGMQMGYGHVLKTCGDQAAALRAYRTAIAAKPDFGEVYWSMANLKVFRFEDAEVEAMEAQVARSDLAESTDVHFRFALAKAMEDRGEFEQAWHYYRTGNERQRRLVYHDPLELDVQHEQIIEVFSREFLDRNAGHGYGSVAPIFIVGLPRSGSTLIEQVLASHSQVEGTAELPTLNRIALSLGRYRPHHKQYPLAVRELRTKDLAAYGRQYIEDTRAYRATDRPHFTDKLPNNFSHVGLMHLILPGAKVINARRHPLDSILGSFKQLFGKGQHFTYDMDELTAYYRRYHETMRHWHAVLPGKVLDVHYEDMVADLAAQVRRILAHCGLPFEESCLRFHETQRAVKTASSEQVRQPIYTRALGTWRRYEPFLRPWMEQLADILEELPPSVRDAGR